MTKKSDKLFKAASDWAARSDTPRFSIQIVEEARTAFNKIAEQHACHRCSNSTIGLTKEEQKSGEFVFKFYVTACAKFALSANTEGIQVNNTWDAPFFCSSEEGSGNDTQED